jgi:formamidopyrimidine-DNA glycosylase
VPELPEVETLRRAWARRVPRREVLEVRTGPRYLFRGTTARAVREALLGEVPGATLRHGKVMFVRFGPAWLLLHFGMEGWLTFGSWPEDTGLGLRFVGGARVAYTSQRLLGRVRVVPDARAWVQAQGLGPDAFGLPAGQFVACLRGRKGPLKARLLDQHVLAGVGNLYADEACFQARVHPAARVERLGEEELLRVHAELQRVLRAGIAAHADARDYPRSWLWHRRERHGTCPRCGTALQFSRVAGRGTWACPREQVRP